MNASDIILYTTLQGEVRVEVFFEDETFWLSQRKIAELFGKDVRTVNEHLSRIFEEGELDKQAVIRNFRITDSDGKSYDTQHYNLDAIIASGVLLAGGPKWIGSSRQGVQGFSSGCIPSALPRA